jgi:ring-1,2-phenylacetyl-CoA epoxidase subunit PaaD
VSTVQTVETARAALEAVVDPEIPVLTIGDLGIIRDVRVEGGSVEVDITPTYSGCPAMEVIRRDIDDTLTAAGFETVTVRIVYGQAWTTDWMTERGRIRLAGFGIAPPAPTSQDSPILCPRCSSAGIRFVSQFGSTSCKALLVCEACLEPFDHFKVVEP